MSSLDLKDLEKKTFGSLFMDGLLDIQIGLIWLIVAFNMIFQKNLVFFPIMLLIPIGYIAIKRWVVKPRTGAVRFQKQRKKKMIVVKAVLIVVILSGFGVLMLMKMQIIPEFETHFPIMPVAVGSLLLLVFTVLGYVLAVRRFYLYGVVVAAAFGLSEYVIQKTESLSYGAFPMMLVAFMMVITGGVLFCQFLKKFPKPERED